MKRYFLPLIILISTLSMAQPDTIIRKRNEIKIDLFNKTFLGKFSITYERLIDEDFSFGITAIKTYPFLLDIENNNDKRKLNVQIIPYSRYNLYKYDSNSFLYLEGFLAFNTGKYKDIKRLNDGEYAYYKKVYDNFFDVAPGLSLGYKQYILKNIIVDLNLGLGFNLFDPDSQRVIPRVGFNVGYRF